MRSLIPPRTIAEPVEPGAVAARPLGPRRLRPFVQDSLMAGALTATSMVGVVTDFQVDLPEGAAEVTTASIDELGVALALAQTAPIAWRRRAPLVVVSVVTAALFLYSVLGYVRSFAALGFLLALYTVAAYEDRSISAPVGIAAGSVVLLVLWFSPEPVEPDAIVATLLLVGATWFIGDSVRIRRGEFVRLEDRATRLELERDAFTREAVDAERRVIARELHDVVAHDVSVIVTQAAAAKRLADHRPRDALGALDGIEHAGREAMREMRRLMGFLRPAGAVAPTLAPQPGLGDLPTLVARVREAGLPIELRIQGAERPLSPGLDLSAFRIVQEAITNVMKHAGRTRVLIDVCYLPGELQLRIDDEGPGVPARRPGAHPGYGHLGMRERVALFGGSLSVGPRSGGGFRVLATFPIDEELA